MNESPHNQEYRKVWSSGYTDSLTTVILKAGKVESEAVRAALEATDGDYVTGHLRFNEKHNPVKGAVIVELVQDASGKLTTVYKATVNP